MKVQKIVNLLNDMVANDRLAAQDLIEQKVFVEKKKWFEDHLSLILSGDYLTVLGFINGIAGIDGEIIEAVFDDNTGKLMHFQLRKKNG